MLCFARRSSGLLDALSTVGKALVEDGKFTEALPVVCLQEYVQRYECMSVTGTVKARLQKIEALIGGGYAAEAVSLLACVLRGKDLPKVSGAYSGFGTVEGEEEAANSNGNGNSNNEEENVGEEDSTRPGINFYGLPPFHNYAAVDSEINVPAVNWVCGSKTNSLDDVEELRTSYLSKEAMFAYGEELIDCLVVVRVKVIMKMAESEFLPQLQNGSIVSTNLFSKLSSVGGKMAQSLQKLLLVKIKNSCEYDAAAAEAEHQRRLAEEEEKTKTSTEEEEGKNETTATTLAFPPPPPLATAIDIRNCCQCLLFQAESAQINGLFGEVRKLVSTCLGLMVRCGGDDMSLSHSEDELGNGDGRNSYDSKMWLTCRVMLANAALSQGRLGDVRR